MHLKALFFVLTSLTSLNLLQAQEEPKQVYREVEPGTFLPVKPQEETPKEENGLQIKSNSPTQLEVTIKPTQAAITLPKSNLTEKEEPKVNLEELYGKQLFQAALEGTREANKKASKILQDFPTAANYKTTERMEEVPDHLPKSLQTRLKHDTQVTPLMVAAATGNNHLVLALLQAGAPKWEKTKNYKSFAAQFAAICEEFDTFRLLLDKEESPYSISIYLPDQKARLYKDGELVFESPVSTGKKSHPTPPGNYIVTDKHRHHTSNLYHASMPYFMRFSYSAFGTHAGNLPGYPASHGCIRMHAKDAKKLFQLAPVGTEVQIIP